MIHKMKLKEEPFENIKNETKTIEFRLYDEKRQKVKIGDKIEFSKLPGLQEKILVDVVDIYKNKTFRELFEKLIEKKRNRTKNKIDVSILFQRARGKVWCCWNKNKKIGYLERNV